MVYITTPVIPSCFMDFSAIPILPLNSSIFINPVLDYGFVLLIMKTVVNSVIILHSNAINVSVHT